MHLNIDSKLSPLVVQEPKTANPKITLAKTLDDYKSFTDQLQDFPYK